MVDASSHMGPAPWLCGAGNCTRKTTWDAPARRFSLGGDNAPQVLASVTVREPRMPVYSNVTGAPFASAAAIAPMLARQLVEPVRWEATITGLVRGAGKEQLFELGPSAQIKAMVKRIDMGVWKAMRNVSV